MIKHALAVALLGLGIGFTGHAAVHAAPPPSGVAASSMMSNDTVVKVSGRCLELPPVAVTAAIFFQLLLDDEIDAHCDSRFSDDDFDRHADDEHKQPTYKDGGYAQPKDTKGSLR